MSDNFKKFKKFKIERPDDSVIFETKDKLDWSEMFVCEGWYKLEIDDAEVYLVSGGRAEDFLVAKINQNGVGRFYSGDETEEIIGGKEEVERRLRLRSFQ